MDSTERILEALGFDLRRLPVRHATIELRPMTIPVLEAQVELLGSDGRPVIGDDEAIVTELRRYELVERTETTEARP